MTHRFDRFSLAIFEISRCWHKLAADEMAKYDLKGPHAMYLMTIQRYSDGITSAQLAELCGRDKADVSRSMSLMEAKGLIRREGKYYRALLKLTEKGIEAAARVGERASVAVEYAGRGFSEEYREIFYQVLETITANLQTLSREGIPQS